MSQNNKEKRYRPTFKERLLNSVNLPIKNKGEKYTKKEITGSVMSVVGLVSFIICFVCGFLTALGNKQMSDVTLIISIVCFSISLVMITVGSILSKGKRGMRHGRMPLERDIGSIDSYYKKVDETEINKKEKENIELISQYERLYEQGLISKEELERRKNNILK